MSVVTPSYNQAAYIEDTLRSVASQDYPAVEHIVIDACSDDGTADILERWRPRLAHVVIEPDRGQADAINKGMALARGDILTWLNSDDQLAPGALASAVQAFRQTGADMVAGVVEVESGGQTIERHLTCAADGSGRAPLDIEGLLDLTHGWHAGKYFYQPEVLFTRDLWLRAGARVDDSLRWSMDYELWTRFAEAGAQLAVIGRPVARFRVHPQQKTSDRPAFEAELEALRPGLVQRLGRDPAPHTPARIDHATMVFLSDAAGGTGASIAHERLARACAAAGHRVHLLACTDGPTYDTSPSVGADRVLEAIASHAPDLVVLGPMHSAALQPSVIDRACRRWATAFVLHDQWLFTGRSPYTAGRLDPRGGYAEDWTDPSAYPAADPANIREAWLTKRRALHGAHAPLLLAGSAWIAEFAREALAQTPAEIANAGPVAPVARFPLAVPTDTFRPERRDAVRRRLGLPTDRPIIATATTDARDPRKGLGLLVEAMGRLRHDDAILLLLGAAGGDIEDLGPNVRAVGHIESPGSLASWYATADLHVHPARMESFGQTLMEAAACGVPSVALANTGIPDSLIHDVTGVIAERPDAGALADAIDGLLDDDDRRARVAASARRYAESRHSLAAAYAGFFGALDRSGWRERLGLRRKIGLSPEDPPPLDFQLIPPERPRWEARSGWTPWEGPYPDHGLPRCRWTLGPVARFVFRGITPGPKTVVVHCHNYWAGQRVRLCIAGDAQPQGEHRPEPLGDASPQSLGFRLTALRNTIELELHCWVWDRLNESRPVALLVTGIDLLDGFRPVRA
ncbi:MAG: glycosyltransferase [Phycisphaeraceae bacterium]|nr:MAG: glycosyltransferase [Phycisphaeraceae bacterium]